MSVRPPRRDTVVTARQLDLIETHARAVLAFVAEIRGQTVDAHRSARTGLSGGSFGERVASARKAVGMKQKTLAVQSGISAAMLCQIEHDRLAPSVGVARRISDALGASLDELCGK